MADLPGWLLTHGVLTAFFILGSFFLTGLEEDAADPTGAPLEEDTAFNVILDVISFQGIGGLPDWFGWLMFFVFPFVWILIGVALVLPLASGLLANPIAGVIAGLAAVALITAFIIF